MIETILQSHYYRYPAMQIQDLYKLLHQASFGSGHAVLDPESARNWLMREVAELGEGPPEPMIDPISAGGEIVKVHLRPFVKTGHDQEALLEAFVRTANNFHGDVRRFEVSWQVAMETAKFPSKEMLEFFHGLEEQNYPAVHHSRTYDRLYRPAYRVVARLFCPDAWL